jgi:hypothetical protein
VTGLENGYLLAGAGAFALACGGAVLLFAFWQARRSRDAFRKSPAYFRAVARSDDRSIHNMGDFFGAAAAIGIFIAVLVAAISSTGWVIGRTLGWIVAGAAATVAFLLVFRAWWVFAIAAQQARERSTGSLGHSGQHPSVWQRTKR